MRDVLITAMFLYVVLLKQHWLPGDLMNFKEKINEIYDSRYILKSLVVRNLIGRYKNSLLGFLWHFITPIVMMIAYYLVFSFIRSNPIPDFWVYLSSTILPLTFMITNLTTGSGCIVSSSSMIKKMYFPREIIVLSQIVSSFIVMILGYVVVIIVIALSGYNVTIYWASLPLILLLMSIFATGFTLAFSALTVYVRDIQHMLRSASILIYLSTPMYFTLEGKTGILLDIVSVNPFTYYVELLHQIVYYGECPHIDYLVICVIMSFFSVVIGYIVFSKLKNGFVERL